MRQIGWLLATVVLLSLAGAVGVNLHATRETLQTQLRVKNSDNAQGLALALSQQRGDTQLMELLLAAQFDTGFYRRIRFVQADGSTAFERSADAPPREAPGWFAARLPIDSAPGVALVNDGWRALGRVEVVSQTAYAHDELWRGGSRSALLLLLLGAVAIALAAFGVSRIRRPLDAMVEQANALVDGRYLIVDEPRVPELQRVARAMNGMVERLRRLFEAQAAQVEQLRREAHEDRVTALPHRAHFVQRLAVLLGPDGGPAAGSLLLVRVADMPGLNHALGRETTDRALRVLADVLRTWPSQGALAGRLNGSDFALALPGAGVAAQAAPALAQALRDAVQPCSGELVVYVGAVDWSAIDSPGPVLARADLALARAESGAPFAAHAEQAGDAVKGAAGEAQWHNSLQAAVRDGRARLIEFPVLDRRGALSHLECPLRLQIEPGGAFEPAARWLPLAARSRLMPKLDLLAARLALKQTALDGRARAVNLALASIADGGFVAQLRALLAAAPHAASQLWLEVGEAAAPRHLELLRDFAALVRPCGARFGLEHAGHELYRSPRLYEIGLDCVKLDAALVRGVAKDEAVRRFVAGSVALLRALPLVVCAEGIDDAADAQALWDCGLDAITGPWASAQPVHSHAR
jgi:EAL domain-containing protein (putative c-di-GMP-specific phosphodiesterase class I)/GGDEF domain-containing protein